VQRAADPKNSSLSPSSTECPWTSSRVSAAGNPQAESSCPVQGQQRGDPGIAGVHACRCSVGENGDMKLDRCPAFSLASQDPRGCRGRKLWHAPFSWPLGFS